MEDGEALATLDVQPNLRPLFPVAGPRSEEAARSHPCAAAKSLGINFSVKKPQPSQCSPGLIREFRSTTLPGTLAGWCEAREGWVPALFPELDSLIVSNNRD